MVEGREKSRCEDAKRVEGEPKGKSARADPTVGYAFGRAANEHEHEYKCSGTEKPIEELTRKTESPTKQNEPNLYPT